MMAITDNDPDLASSLAEEFGQKIWELREDFRVDFPSIDTALTYSHESNKHPIVLADISDNAGGGAPSDSTVMLRAVLEKDMNDVAVGIFWDPGCRKRCRIRSLFGWKTWASFWFAFKYNSRNHEYYKQPRASYGRW